MTEYTIVVFGAGHLTVEPALRAANVRAWVLHQVPFSPPSGGLTFLAIGPEGGAALARWVEAHGLDGVTGVGLVGVTAPWAKRGTCYGEWVGGSGGHKRWKRCGALAEYVSSFDVDDADPEPLCQEHFDSLHPKSRDMWKPARVLLGPLEPLRAVAERARRCAPLCPSCRSERVRPDTDDCKHFICACGHAFTPTPLRIVIACTPDDGVCRTCGGRGRQGSAWEAEGSYDCPTCDGAGKALSSADVGREFSGDADQRDSIACRSKGGPIEESWGGLTVIHYPTRADLDKYGLRDVIASLLQ